MEIRECTADDVVSLLHCASDDKSIYELQIDDWAQYQRWLIDCIYHKHYQVLVADDGYGVIGFLVWDCFQVYYKWLAYLHYIYVNGDNRKTEVADKLVIEFIHNCFNSRAQRLKFDSRVLPPNWVKAISYDAPLSEYTTYYTGRSEELTEWFNINIRPLKE